MAVGVEVLHLSIVCPLVRHVEGSFDGTAVGVEPAAKEVFIEGLVEIVDGVVKREHDKLGNLVGGVTTRDVFSSAVAVRNLAECRVTVTRLELSFCSVVD